MRFLVLLMALSLGTAYCFPAPPKKTAYRPRVYSVEQLRSDFAVLRKTLEERHPSLYRYVPREKMNQQFDSVFRQLYRPMTEVEFRDLLRPLIVQIRCGHTDVQESLYTSRSTRKPQPEWLPFDIILQNDRLFIGRNRSTDSSLICGTEVLKLGNYPVKDIIQAARDRWPSDGYNQTFKNYFLELYHLEDTYWRHFSGRSPWTLTVRDTTGTERLTTVRRRPVASGDLQTSPAPATVKRSKKSRHRTEASYDEDDAKLQLMRSLHFINSDSTAAMLIINSFGYERYQSFHREVFETLEKQKVQDLVIDLRQNTGGNAEIGSDLMSYLMKSDFRQVDRAECRVRRPNACSYFDRKEKRVLRQNFRFMRAEGGRYHFGKSNVGWNKPASEHRFTGRVYILTSGRTFSAASIFTASLKAQRTVTIIGQETGGGEAGCNGGIIQTLTLPETRLRVRFPVFWIATASRNPDQGRGVMPDYSIEYTVRDRIKQRDRDLEKALELIQSGKRKMTLR
ncbi:S41 family peptidase [Larkinella insperata]|uniref:S41 family peptidase n=1 Tax=Larkinella insperata TaxID=332158 RepID=A0ABW3QDM4_9BACT|nr:S41 family peptidase [Larkinella insperata]